jgi:hypothetical protein
MQYDKHAVIPLPLFVTAKSVGYASRPDILKFRQAMIDAYFFSIGYLSFSHSTHPPFNA